MRAGRRLGLDGHSTAEQILRTGRPARVDDYRVAPGPIAEALRDLGIRSTVGSPIVVEGRTWGAMIVASVRPEPMPPETESRIAEFTELVATAVANEASRAALAASRARIVTAGDQARQRIERNLHDGAQQRLVSLGLALRAAEAQAPDELRELLGEAVGGVTQLIAELQEISRGLHPAALSSGGGLEAALGALARRSAVPAELDLRVQRRLPDPVEVALYYIVSEALTNAAKHAGASHVAISVGERDGVVELLVRDDGAGGADPSGGSGLIGLRDRVEAIGGRIEVDSPAGAGTSLRVTLPTTDILGHIP
jgi:signal transduction histidine kinase